MTVGIGDSTHLGHADIVVDNLVNLALSDLTEQLK